MGNVRQKNIVNTNHHPKTNRKYDKRKIGFESGATEKQYFGFFVLLIVEAGFMLAILFGNPFDFKYQIQFLPFYCF